MVDTNFRETLLDLAPPWLQGPFGARLLYGPGILLDAVADLCSEAIRARVPREDTQPEALAFIGGERGIVRGIDEPASRYVVRLRRWLDDWRIVGNPRARLRQLWGYMGPNGGTLRSVFSDNAALPSSWWVSLAAGDEPGEEVLTRFVGGNWNWDDYPARRSRFWTLIYPGSVWQEDGTWNDPGTWDDGGTWDTTATPEQVAAVRGIIGQWRAAHAESQWTLIVFDANAFAPDVVDASYPDGSWGQWSRNAAGVAVAARPLDVSFWDGPG